MADYWPIITFAVLFLSVPLQFYLSPKSGDLKYHLVTFVDQAKLKLKPISEYLYGPTPVEKEPSLDSLDLLDELLKKNEVSLDKGHFASSEDPRDPRSPNVKFHVGQVFRHKKFRYRAVIVGWDERANAPDFWLKEVHKNKKEWIDNPNYLVLIDTRDKTIPQIGYVIQENIEPVTEVTKIIHPFLDKYFERFVDGRYIMRPYLERIYPFG
ncbi:YccV-like domain-containing protein [Aphelenchoides bicaudatus]|nr:YccV-like domain-containing protein [Aphelenchoides bicaudatus]